MRVLLDECLPKSIKREFQKYEVSTVPEMGWAGKSNGELLKLAEEKFDVFITVDQNLQYQQNLEQSQIAVILLSIKNNRLETFKPLVPKVKEALEKMKQHERIRIKA